jgi:hypothetical protein
MACCHTVPAFLAVCVCFVHVVYVCMKPCVCMFPGSGATMSRTARGNCSCKCKSSCMVHRPARALATVATAHTAHISQHLVRLTQNRPWPTACWSCLPPRALPSSVPRRGWSTRVRACVPYLPCTAVPESRARVLPSLWMGGTRKAAFFFPVQLPTHHAQSATPLPCPHPLSNPPCPTSSPFFVLLILLY